MRSVASIQFSHEDYLQTKVTPYESRDSPGDLLFQGLSL